MIEILTIIGLFIALIGIGFLALMGPGVGGSDNASPPPPPPPDRS